MAGMDRRTGRPLEGWDHIRQSLEVIFTTRIGTRVERRSFGSLGPELQDRPANQEATLDHFVAIAEAIDAFEPRVTLQGFRIVEASADGRATIEVQVAVVGSTVDRNIEVTI